MARGKHAAAAAARRARADDDLVARLTAEVRDLKAELRHLTHVADENEQLRRTVDQLTADVDANTSRTLDELNARLYRIRTDRDEARAEARRVQQKHDTLVERVFDHLVDVHRMTGPEALEWMAAVLGGEGTFNTTASADPEAARRIQRARGERRPHPQEQAAS